MDLLLSFFIQNYVLLIMLVGITILTFFDVFLDRSKIKRLRLMLVLLFVLTVFDHLEIYTSTLAPSQNVIMFRTLLSALCYSLRPVIVMMLVFITYRKASLLITIPAIVNVIAAFSAFFTNIVFTILPTNVYSRGPLGFTPYVVSLLYVAGLFLVSFRVLAKRSFEEGAITMLLALTASIAALLTALEYKVDINLTYGAEILLYYLYVYGQYTRRDALTGLLNRQSFYSDIEKRSGSITGVISIDMNELKWLNDNLGHSAGDKALKAVSAAFMRSAAAKERIYRIGGDEFVTLCRGRTAGEMEQLVADMRSAVSETGYSCAFGLSTDGSIKEMIKEADALMYEDKAKIKAEILENGGVLHPRG